MQVFLIAIACVWPLLLGARGGVRAVDPLQVDTARSFGLGPVAIVRRVVLPGDVPAIVTALRLSASLGLVVAVGAQLISGSPGLGSLLVSSQNAGRNDVVWACLLVTGAHRRDHQPAARGPPSAASPAGRHSRRRVDDEKPRRFALALAPARSAGSSCWC